MSPDDREVSWAEAAEVARRTLLDAEARRDALAERDAMVGSGTGAEEMAFVEALGDQQRIAAGWLPPDKAERLKLEVARLDAHAARRGYEDSVRSRIFGSTARERDQYEAELATARAELAAVQPVIDAARPIVDKLRDWANHEPDIARFVAAVDALDAVSPLEGLKQ